MYFRNFVIISPWERARSLFEQTWISFTQEWFVPSLVEIGRVSSSGEDFWNWSMLFRNFVIISPWERAGLFIWINLYTLYPWMLCAMFDWNWPTGSEKMIFKFRLCIFTISLLSSFGKGQALHLKKIESSLPKDDLCQVWLKLAQWFWIFQSLQNIFAIS